MICVNKTTFVLSQNLFTIEIHTSLENSDQTYLIRFSFCFGQRVDRVLDSIYQVPGF